MRFPELPASVGPVSIVGHTFSSFAVRTYVHVPLLAVIPLRENTKPGPNMFTVSKNALL